MSKGQPTSTTSQFATLDPRTQRAIGEDMEIALLGAGIYHVHSQSDETYLVDLPGEYDEVSDRSSATCTCPDYEKGTQGDDCKHIRRVKLDIAFGRLPRPATSVDETSGLDLAESTTLSEDVSLAADGGTVQNITTHGNGTSPSPSTPASSEVGSGAPNGVYQQIAERINEIEAELDRHRAELKELETALSVFEEYGDK